MILVDTNVLMYAAGAPSPFKERSSAFQSVSPPGRLTRYWKRRCSKRSLRRYRALDRWQDGRRLFDLTRTLFPVVLPVTVEVMDRARVILDAYPHLMARMVSMRR